MVYWCSCSYEKRNCGSFPFSRRRKMSTRGRAYKITCIEGCFLQVADNRPYGGCSYDEYKCKDVNTDKCKVPNRKIFFFFFTFRWRFYCANRKFRPDLPIGFHDELSSTWFPTGKPNFSDAIWNPGQVDGYTIDDCGNITCWYSGWFTVGLLWIGIRLLYMYNSHTMQYIIWHNY